MKLLCISLLPWIFLIFSHQCLVVFSTKVCTKNRNQWDRNKEKSENLKPSSWLFEQINTTDKPLVRKRNQKLSILRMKGQLSLYILQTSTR